MIVIRVELWSAITGEKTELARMHITNDATGDMRRRNYVGETFVGRSTGALNRLQVSKRGAVKDWPSEALHIWNLVARMLSVMGYTQGPKA